MLVYLDTNIVIYFVEQPPGWGPKASARLAQYRANQVNLAASDLTRMECRVGPLISGNAIWLADFDTFFASLSSRLFAITGQVCERAASIRATYRFSALDSLHLAAAVEGNCDVFLTNDQRLSKFQGLTVEAL